MATARLGPGEPIASRLRLGREPAADLAGTVAATNHPLPFAPLREIFSSS